MKASGIRHAFHGIAQFAVTEHLRQFGQDLEVPFGRLVRHEEGKYDVYRLGVGRIEWHR